MYALLNALRIKGSNLIFWHSPPCGCLCLRFRLSHQWNLTLWFLNTIIQSSKPTQLSQKSFIHCWLPTKLNIRKGSLLYELIWSFQTRCKECWHTQRQVFLLRNLQRRLLPSPSWLLLCARLLEELLQLVVESSEWKSKLISPRCYSWHFK